MFASFSIPAESLPPTKIQVQHLVLEGDVPLNPGYIQSLLAPHENKEHTLTSLTKIARLLEKAIQQQGYVFYRVVLPQQKLDETATVQFNAVAMTLNQVDYEGNLFFDSENLNHALPRLVIGLSPNTEELAQDLKVATYHPLKDMRITFKPSDSPNQVDAMVKVVDAEPENIALILSNTGNDETGDYRLTASYQNTNLWNADHILNMSFTTSPGYWKDVQQYGASYSAPLYQQHAWLTGYFIYSDVDSGVVNGLDISGAGTMMGVHYLRNLKRIDRYEHWIDVGLDNKLFENDVYWGTTLLTPQNVRSFPLSLKYKGEYPWADNLLEFYVEHSRNTGWGSDNDDIAYQLNRTNADDDWSAWRYGFTLNRPYHGWNLQALFSAQFTDDALISGEQFGLGGASSIRGYEEREVARDKGYSLKLQGTSPQKPWGDGLGRFVGFFDYGSVTSEDWQAGDPQKTQKLASAGVGLRWQYQKTFLTSIELAHALKDGASGQTASGDNKIHATLMMNF